MLEAISEYYAILLVMSVFLLTLGYVKNIAPLKLAGALIMIVMGFELGREFNLLIFLTLGASGILIILDTYGR